MIMGDLISIIIPVYNAEKYLYKCLESVCGQTYQQLEIILVDDGSTDSSGHICDEWAEKDERIGVIHKQNGGVSAARNDGLKASTGAYIGFVDSDDWIDPKMYEKAYEAIKTLGFKGAAIDRVLSEINEPNATTEDVIRLALAKLRK